VEKLNRGWAAVLAISLGSFTLVLTELLPVALLTPIARDLDVSAGAAGWMIASPAVVASLSALTLGLVGPRIDRRVLLLTFSGVLLASNAVAALAPNFTVMLGARILLGVGIGGFWAVAGGVAPRLVAPRQVAAAAATILGGISVATVAAVPVGALLGNSVGWRGVFAGAAALAALAVVLQLVTVPRLPADGVGLPLLRVLRSPGVIALLVAVMLVFSGQFASYSYIEPFLESSTSIAPALFALVLVLYGAGGIAGNFAGGALAGQRPERAGWALPVVLAFAMVVTVALAPVALVFGAIGLVLWGVAFGAAPTTFQLSMYRLTPGSIDAGSVLIAIAIQASIAVGAAFGGVWVDAAGVPSALWFGASLVVLSLVPLLVRLRMNARSAGVA
jgi:predicted MFS family arabinose efflux permease